MSTHLHFPPTTSFNVKDSVMCEKVTLKVERGKVEKKAGKENIKCSTMPFVQFRNFGVDPIMNDIHAETPQTIQKKSTWYDVFG